jgi:putative hemolysin
MLDLEATARTRFPSWFLGARAPVARALVRQVARFARIDDAARLLDSHAHLHGFELVEALLQSLDAGYLVDPIERQRIPEAGPVVVCSNHPLGLLDALALLHCVGQVRRDVRIVANDLLGSIAGLRGLLLPVRVLGGAVTADSVRAIDDALAARRAVLVFPAGEVARLGWRGVREAPWQRGFVWFAARAGAPVVPAHVRARNSSWFYAAAAIAAPLGTALLPREAVARKGQRMTIRIGHALATEHARDPVAALALVGHVRAAVDAIARGTPGRGAVAPVAHVVAHADIVRDVARLPCLAVFGARRIHAGRVAPGSALMAEIGRLRELTFRAVGEGSGEPRDLDRFDADYDHIVLWDTEACRIVGAYRMAPCARILAERGESGLYTSTLFEYDAQLRTQLPHSLELGRSFVQPAYRGSRSLDLLWTGIGAYLRTQSAVRWLFGPVSISAALPPAARDQLVAYYRAYHGAPAREVCARVPYRPPGDSTQFGALDADAAMRVLRANLAALGADVPCCIATTSSSATPVASSSWRSAWTRRSPDASTGSCRWT